ncbi:MAG: DUF262 domain-containing protein [Candidatus Coprenecus sp.]|nr:DUF262 domain-containing protein [Candidatus Coprenecus sp.]
MTSNTITLFEYLNKVDPNNGAFIIPSYQRGYVWGQERVGQRVNSVVNILESLIDGFNNNKEIFLQGITVCEDGNNITLVDGQQRTTFFYLLLKYLNFDGHFSIRYAVREQSDTFLKEFSVAAILNADYAKLDNEEFQDIYYFKKSIFIIDKYLKNIKPEDFREYVKSKVRFLYISIPEEKATIIFSMMNGNKAQMLNEELIKSELLRSASLTSEKSLISEAENTAIRSRLAREWDSWLYWWNDKEHQEYFHIQTQLGWLLPLVNNSDKISFEDFRKKNLETATVKSAKLVFKKMRLLQKSIEDAYNNPKTYNAIGAILHFRDTAARRFTFLRWYFDQVANVDKSTLDQMLKKYYDWSMLGINHEDIVDDNLEKFYDARDEFRTKLEDDLLYRTGYEVAARWLLRLNIAEDSSQESGEGRKFDFEIWRERSLEHIYAKSKVAHVQDSVNLSWDDKVLEDTSHIELWRHDIKYIKDDVEYTASEHSIGNLVLLYKDDNSRFNADRFQDKKEIFFRNVGDSLFKSRHLIHTISIFANSDWTGEEIAKHKKEELETFDKQYSIYGNESK